MKTLPSITSKIGATLKGKNLLLWEQFLSFKSSPYRYEAKYFVLMPLYYKYFSYACVLCVMSVTPMQSKLSTTAAFRNAQNFQLLRVAVVKRLIRVHSKPANWEILSAAVTER